MADHLSALAPAEENRVCDLDLGPRWMLVYVNGRNLIGVVVDDYGCRDVRLTDDPFETPPGDASQAGTVPGVLEVPSGLLSDLKAVVGR